MLNTTTFVGLDVHARSIKAVALDAMTGEVRSATFAYDAAAVAEGGILDPAAKCVYESGVTGFDLQKKLTALGVDCVVGAVSEDDQAPADRKRRTTATTPNSSPGCPPWETSSRSGFPTTNARRRATWCARRRRLGTT